MDHPDTETGARFGKYRLVNKVGEGAYGKVYEAILPGPMGFSKRVAIKKLHGRLLAGGGERFVRGLVNEARVGGLLHHVNVVDILEFGQEGPHYYIAMEYVHGVTLAEMLAQCAGRETLLPRFAVLDFGMQICRGLEHAHTLRDEDGRTLGLVHRDLKPSNILVNTDGVAKISDFGIVKAASNRFQTTDERTAKGTPRYMSPEQIRAQSDLNARSDLFSLGLLLYEMAVGSALFGGLTIPEVVHRSLHEDLDEDIARADELLPGLAPILRRCLARDPEDRYASAAEVGQDLRQLVQRHPSEAELSEVVALVLPGVDRPGFHPIDTTGDLDLAGVAAEESESNLTATVTTTLTVDAGNWDHFTQVFTAPTDAGPPPAAPAEPQRARGPWWLLLVGAVVIGVAAPALWDRLGDDEGDATPLDSTTLPGVEPPTASEPVTEPDPVTDPVTEAEPETETEAETETDTETEPEIEAETEPETEAETVAAPPSPPDPPGPGTVTLNWQPWAIVRIDGDVVDVPVLARYPLDGGDHRISLTCPTLGDKTREFTVHIDGQDEHLGCWNFREDRRGCE